MKPTPQSIGVAALLLSLSIPAAHAAVSSTPPLLGSFAQESDLAGEVEDIIDEYDEAYAAFYALMEKASSDDERRQLWEESRVDNDAYAARLDAVVQKDPTHAAAVTAIEWILGNADSREYVAGYLSILTEHHLGSEALGSICSSLSRSGSLDTSTERFFRTVMEKSESHSAKGHATYALASLLGSRVRLKEQLSSMSEEDTALYTQWLGEETLALCDATDAEAARVEHRALLEKVRDEFTDVTHWGERTIADSARGELFELDHLQVGMVAPEISGPDLDGVEFKLSDYRGQVVFLDFWGDW